MQTNFELRIANFEFRLDRVVRWSFGGFKFAIRKFEIRNSPGEG